MRACPDSVPRYSDTFRRGLRGALPLLLTLLVLAIGCDRIGGPSRPTTESPILLAALDGLEWNVILPMVRSGELPVIADLMERGAYGLLETDRPTYSPILWTTVATSKGKRQHGIAGFVHRRKGEKPQRLANSWDRRTKAFWNILSDYGRKVAVVGWWMTYPAEPVNGVMVSQVNTMDQTDRKQGKAIIKGSLREGVDDQVFPSQRQDEFLAIHQRVSEELPELNLEIFGAQEHAPSTLTARLWENTQWAFRADATYIQIAERLAEEDFDLVAFYLGGTDVVGHRFWRHMDPDEYSEKPSPEEIEDFGNVLPDYYKFADAAIGRVLENMPSDTRVFVVSDHGMYGINRKKNFDPDNIPKDVNSGHHRRAPEGVFIAAGPGLGRGERPASLEDLTREDLPTIGHLKDITPTLLALLDIPTGADMEGHVLTGLVERDPESLEQVPSHDDDAWKARRAELDPAAFESNPERMEQLRALGYIN